MDLDICQDPENPKQKHFFLIVGLQIHIGRLLKNVHATGEKIKVKEANLASTCAPHQ